MEQLHTAIAQDCVVVLAVVSSSLCAQAVKQLTDFVPDTVNIVTVNIYDHPDFQYSHRVTVIPTGYIYKNGQIAHEFKMPFDKDQILCWIK